VLAFIPDLVTPFRFLILEGLKKIKQFTVDSSSVETNMVSVKDEALYFLIFHNVN
jgi:hypothetical protein